MLSVSSGIVFQLWLFLSHGGTEFLNQGQHFIDKHRIKRDSEMVWRTGPGVSLYALDNRFYVFVAETLFYSGCHVNGMC